ncbi:MAG: serpin family protein [Bacteroidia bacterium]|nr:serpin family protein [Bacteroidia bacterium]
MKKLYILTFCIMLSGVNKLYAQDSALTDNNNQFAFELFARLDSGKNNIFISPFSISSALSMTYAGARTITEKEMQKVLHFDSVQNTFHQRFSSVIEKMKEINLQKGIELRNTNGLWAQKNYRFSNDFFNLLGKFYFSEIHYADFVKKTEKSRAAINRWVEKETNLKIKELLKPGSVDANTMLVLVNAIYFYGTWQNKFNPEKTTKDKFYIDKDQTIEIDFMHQHEKFFYFEDKIFQAVELPYAGNKLSMFVILPNNGDITGFISGFDLAKYNEMVFTSREAKVDISMPKFKITGEYDLEEYLSLMGMPSAFGSGADFSGMTGSKGLFIDKIKHKAVIEINEEGTEAAAATAVIMRKNAMISKKFLANHPFIFIIKDNTTGSVLFLGKVENPSQME